MANFISDYTVLVQQNFSEFFEEIKKPKFPIIYSLCTSFSYLSLRLFTSIRPMHGLAFLHIAYFVNQLVAPLFSIFEPYRNISLVPLATALGHLTLTAIITRRICHLFQSHLTMKQIYTVSLIFFTNLYLSKIVFSYMKKN